MCFVQNLRKKKHVEDPCGRTCVVGLDMGMKSFLFFTFLHIKGVEGSIVV